MGRVQTGHSLFTESLHQRLGPCAMVGDLAELGKEDMLQYDPYKDEMQNAETVPTLDEGLEVIPELGDQYLNACILLLRGDRMAKGQVVHLKNDDNSDTIGRTNQNPILGTHLYKVEFIREEITKLAVNNITELMMGMSIF